MDWIHLVLCAQKSLGLNYGTCLEDAIMLRCSESKQQVLSLPVMEQEPSPQLCKLLFRDLWFDIALGCLLCL
jgi:hypothetical protein